MMLSIVMIPYRISWAYPLPIPDIECCQSFSICWSYAVLLPVAERELQVLVISSTAVISQHPVISDLTRRRGPSLALRPNCHASLLATKLVYQPSCNTHTLMCLINDPMLLEQRTIPDRALSPRPSTGPYAVVLIFSHALRISLILMAYPKRHSYQSKGSCGLAHFRWDNLASKQPG